MTSSSVDVRLPIFPLGMVLFPGTSAPLHLFEPRYRQMLADVRAKDSRFGILCALEGVPERELPTGRIGCVAEVVDVEPFDPSDYREHYETNYATLSQALGLGDFASYELAYKFGSEMRMDRRFAGERWSTIEPNAKKSWEARNPGTWNHFQEAVKHAWERAKDR